MIKNVVLVFFVGLLLTPSIHKVRDLYKASSSSKEKAIAFYNTLKNVKTTDGYVLNSYKAASIALKAKYEKGIKNKKALFKEGVLSLEKNIAKHPNNIELRLIRLSIQENTPKLLKYKKNIFEDKSFINKHLKKVTDKKLRNYIKTFVLQSKSFTKEEKNVISKL